ncbi:MAG TPA: hypothetical protein VFX22_04055 [Candidatus Kapabacteria bacterium]|nr:hypothetical protein [Candidatus Kapabacteria bacterium]
MDTVVFPHIFAGGFMDSTLNFKFGSRDTISSIVMSDSNWAILNTFPYPVTKDSTALIIIRYKPQTPGLHTGTISLVAGSNVAMNISLIGSGLSPFPRATASINFGVVPLWREADTTFTLHMNGLAPISSIQISDSDWSVLNSQPIQIRQEDSSVVLNILYQPRSVMEHQGNLSLMFGHDTLGLVSLSGNTSPFVRKIGDCYIFLASPSSALDSVLYTTTDHPFVSSARTDIGNSINWITIDSSGDFFMWDLGGTPGEVRLPIVTGTPYSLVAQGYDSSMFGLYNENYEGFREGSSNIAIGSVSLTCELVSANAFFSSYLRPTYNLNADSLLAAYSPGIGFFTSIDNYSYHTSDPNLTGPWVHESYKLIRFHLKR